LSGGDVLEIQGPPGSGKSQLLYHLLITCLLPYQVDAVVIGGWEKAAVLFDTDNTFDVQLFRTITEQRLNHLLPGRPPLFIKIFVQTASNNLHIYRPASSLQLASSLLRLSAYHAATIVDRSIGIIAVDSLSAFYWEDKLVMELEAKAGNSTATIHPLKRIQQGLEKVRISHGAAIVFTNWGLQLSGGDGSSTTPFYRQHLQGFPSISQGSALPSTRHHITIPLSIYPQLPINPTSKDLETWNNERQRKVGTGEFNGFVRTEGQETVGHFKFTIGHPNS